MITDEKPKIPFWCKQNLTIEEASAYSNIGERRLHDMLRNPACSFVLFVGKKKLVKRKEFEQYLSKAYKI